MKMGPKSFKLDVVLAIPGLPFNGNTFDTQSLGGSESAGYYLGKALAKRGHRVTTFCGTPDRVHCADVDYMPISSFQSYAATSLHDVCIVQRIAELFPGNCRARFSALWCHDLAIGRTADTIRGTAWNYDKLFVLSKFMQDQYQEVYGMPEELLFKTRNGVDLECVSKVRERLPKDVTRNPLALVYSARPERGLDVLLAEIMPRILQYEPRAQLFLSSYDNPVDHLKEFYGNCDILAARLGDRVVKLGALTKAQLYELYHAAGVYTYPVPSPFAPDFDEISCISMMEAMACGLPIVTSARGALPETVAPGAGVLISEPIHTSEYYDAFSQAVLNYMRAPEDWRAASAAGEQHAAGLSWDGVAEQWEELFYEELQKKSSDLATLANHFWRRSDIYAARECLKRLPEDDPKSVAVRTRIQNDWAFIDQPNGFRTQYEHIGSTHDASVLQWAAREPRYAAIRTWLQKYAAEVKSILDYGCAHGAYATNLLKELPDLRITGVDIDQHGIEMAYGFANQLGVSNRWRGVVGGIERLTDPNVPEMLEQYDAVVAQEVLEHVADPAATLAALEQRVRDGGYVYLTIPYGPWEYSDYRRYPFRAHLWEFDLHDLHDLLEKPKGKGVDLHIYGMQYGNSPETEDPLGWWVVQYRVTPETRGKVGQIDWERKLTLQRPRQTVSAAIMAGGAACEETLHWCLRSLVHVVDELVIVNCGLSREALRIIEGYRWKADSLSTERMLEGPQALFLDIKIIPGVDPKVHGFEAPRNIALEHCTQDWVLWIDTDEKLLQPYCLTKYLRTNQFQGYSIRQHHFAVDTHFDADLPVRLFRNNKKLRFYGMIHEHPEEEINKGPGRTIVLNDVHIPHVGYLIESGRQQRFTRNLPMLEADIKKYPERVLQKHFIMRDHMLLSTYELQHNGGKVTEEIRGRAKEVIRIYRENFLGKGHLANVDPITYYSQAVSLLGEGFDAMIQISADKFDAKPNGALKARFANMDDYLVEVTRRARESAQRFESRYY
jgi:glycosyltransferase involved in cell wall biosynthesis/SAM-dependent methyltransferase